ncbi:snRNA-activating protein complex [Babesia bigemina]|uniref:snRNA-activating protein complex n=1 Tax=Babesia bigemina TaxID=5866 RepID=A0A061D151_BABBI|nr:snRNA-activating protein complex [Babesia bigemina]CDR93822.1 snRNA-activating protein complex [Babesia bigemina]|eukprot:XP_012766008.1 snRNA-activating protein complex [Babesia bigemina]
MAWSQSGPQFQRVPHFDICELFDLSSIIIVDGERRCTRPPYCHYESDHEAALELSSSLYPAPKHRRTGVGSVSVLAPRPLPPELQPTVILDCDLKKDLPTSHVDLFAFKDEYRQVIERLDALRQKSIDIKKSRLKRQMKGVTSACLTQLCQLRTETSLKRYLSQPIRTPTITEVIWDAANMNLRHMAKIRREQGQNARKRLDITVDEDSNVWSEKRLHKLFADIVTLDSYQLVIGERRYAYRNMPHELETTRPLILTGPQNQSSAPLLHQSATERYLEEQSRSALIMAADDELIVTVTLYHGVRGHKLREYDILASQSLADLRDAFRCPAEIRPVGVDLEVRGSCFMLNGQLFPDLRGDACDYSEPLLHFYQQFKPGALHTSECIEQSDAILYHMELPVYIPGYLLHHGDCEHRMMITAVRAFDRVRDCPYEPCYPVCVFMPRRRSVQCHICELREADKSVFNSLALPQIPCYLCDDCYGRFQRLGTLDGVYRSDGLAKTAAIEFCEE